VEKRRLSYLLNSFRDHHFSNVVLEVERKLVLFFVGVDTIEMIYVKPELVTIIDDLTASRSFGSASI